MTAKTKTQKKGASRLLDGRKHSEMPFIMMQGSGERKARKNG
jgi:hypothetical protein